MSIHIRIATDTNDGDNACSLNSIIVSRFLLSLRQIYNPRRDESTINPPSGLVFAHEPSRPRMPRITGNIGELLSLSFYDDEDDIVTHEEDVQGVSEEASGDVVSEHLIPRGVDLRDLLL